MSEKIVWDQTRDAGGFHVLPLKPGGGYMSAHYIVTNTFIGLKHFVVKNIFKEYGLDMRDTTMRTEYRTGRRLNDLNFLSGGLGGGDGVGTSDLPLPGIHSPKCAIQLLPSPMSS